MSQDFHQGWAVVPGQCRDSGPGTKIRRTVPSRPLPIPDFHNHFHHETVSVREKSTPDQKQVGKRGENQQ